MAEYLDLYDDHGRLEAHLRIDNAAPAPQDYTEYKALMAAAMRMPVNPLIASDVAALDALVVQIEAADAEHPEYYEMLCRGE